MNSKKALGNGLLLLTALIWGTAFVAQRSGMESIEPITFNAARMALSAILIGGLALVMRAKRRKSPDERHKEGIIPDVVSESGPEMISDSTPKARSNAISESRLENAPGAMSEARTKIGSDVIKETKAEDRNTVLGGVLCGLPRKEAMELAAQMVLGSAALILESGAHPGQLKDAVCSPGGTTIEGVRRLENGAFRASVMDAVIAAWEKNARLG